MPLFRNFQCNLAPSDQPRYFKSQQIFMNKHFGQRTLLLIALFQILMSAQAQVNTVEFGKNRVQYQKFHWKYYKSENFNTYFSQDGLELGKYVAQVAEQELPSLEEFVEYGSQRRINVVVYNNYD